MNTYMNTNRITESIQKEQKVVTENHIILDFQLKVLNENNMPFDALFSE